MYVAEKLNALRAEMRKEKLDVFLVSNSDPHNNEMVADRWKSRQWLVNMKGSSGTVLITQDWCGLWADSRYYEAAEIALSGSEVQLMRASDVDCPSLEKWIQTHISEGAKIGFCGAETSQAQAKLWQESLLPSGYQICAHFDLIERIWKDRPDIPCGKLFFVDESYTGESAARKINRLRANLAARKIDAHLLGRTDESCWLFNFRGTDQEGSATPYCFTLITTDEIYLFIDANKLGQQGAQYFADLNVTLKDYSQVTETLAALPPSTRLLTIPEYTNHSLFQAGKHCISVSGRAPVTDLKSVKNSTEIANMKQALIDDGVAMVRFFHWLETTLQQKQPVTELDCSNKLAQFRSQIEGYRHESFEAIVGYAENGALNHYSVTEESAKTLQQENLLLLDSGGNYVHGLTDTTRVLALGNPTEQQKQDYTAVLAGLIDLLNFEFIEGTTGAQLDAIARAPLWAQGRNFKHGTGHGVGFGTEVHEGPQNISPISTEKFILGQVTTIEPGCYRAGKWGIRIENMVHTVLSRETEFGRFFCFENLTFCPIETTAVDPQLLSDFQLDWLNNYNAEVAEKLTPFLDEAQQQWLQRTCQPLNRPKSN